HEATVWPVPSTMETDSDPPASAAAICSAGDGFLVDAPAAGAEKIGGPGASVSTTNPGLIEGPEIVPSAAVCDTEMERPEVRSTIGIVSAQLHEPLVPVPMHVLGHEAVASDALPVNDARTCSPGAQVPPPTSGLVTVLKRRFVGNWSRLGLVPL